MNVTVRIPPALRAAFEGRELLSLGLPANADIGDLFDTLLSLYPKLRSHMAGDSKQAKSALGIFMSEFALNDLARHRKGLREGQVIYLVGGMPRRPAVTS